MTHFIKTNADGFLKDEKSKLIINTNQNDLTAYQLQRDKLKKEKQLTEKVSNLENDIVLIKTMLMKLLESKES